MKELFNNPGFIALVGTLFGGAGLETIRRLFDRRQAKATEASAIRDELRKEIDRLTALNNAAEARERAMQTEIDNWRGKYYDLREANANKVDPAK